MTPRYSPAATAYEFRTAGRDKAGNWGAVVVASGRRSPRPLGVGLDRALTFGASAVRPQAGTRTLDRSFRPAVPA